ncbi:uncharacterized protein EDB93DRAFT_1198789, partial [Suillus bovinus]|uniref:uncharacterized protein n=1 Tax=Suillus bovinus TaxID=48563 RepID=UPI001B880D93
MNRKISREIGILRILRHNNIVPLWGIATGFGLRPELRCLVSPWMPNGKLSTYLTSNHNTLTVLDRSRILEDVSAGLRYLHSVPVMHGDITGANILIDRGGHARLIDFGLSTITQPLLGQSHLAATSIRPGAIRYAAPELVLPDDARELPVVLEKADIYSFGCIMLQVLSGRRPWSEIPSEGFIIVSISHGCGPQRPDGHPAIMDSDWKFIQKCLQSGPELRPSADEVLDFVTRRFYSPDSCSRPPDDPSDDAPDDFPGASPHGGSEDSHTAEQPPDSPPLPPDHDMKTLFMVADNLSASTSSASVVSVPHSSYHDSQSGISESSTTPRPEWHAPSMLPLSPDQLADQAQRCLERDELSALDEVISLHYDALGYYNAWHACRGQLLGNLAVMLGTRFERRGSDKDLDDAIALCREALALRPVGHTDRSKSLNNLATHLSSRFDHRGNGEDLDDAIALHREALALLPVGHTDRSDSLNNLANRLSSRFDYRGNGEDLDNAIALHKEALALRPVGHTDRSKSLNDLANTLSSRFDHRGNDKDLDDAIALLREALALLPVGHRDRSKSLNDLADTLSSRFDHRGNGKDLNESRENLLHALTLLTQHDPRRSVVHTSMAKVYLSIHHSKLDSSGAWKNIESLNAAMHHFKAAAHIVSAGLPSRLRASLSWVRHADQHSHGTQLEAYVTSMQLLDAYMSVTASLSSRHNAMKEFPSTLVVDAASCALRSGDVIRAVELLEQGRTIIWTQMTRLRTPLDGLQTCGDHAVTLMKRFTDLSSLLDKPPASHPEGTQRVDVEAEATRYRRLVEDWNGTVEEIRMIEGFSRFLLPPLFSDLQDAARDGLVIMLIASESSCDAIIIPHKQPPTSIQLPTDIQKLAKLVLTFRESVEKETGHALVEALNELWNNVVGPVVEKLRGLVGLGSRIWWCPTSLFNFLPLHAAREYRNGGKSLSQLYISSYTPSLTALIKARATHDRPTSVPFVAIGQNFPAGASFTLDAVEPELELVRKLLPPPPTVSFSKITSVDATKSRALRALQENTWIHLACYGTQRFDEPFNSAFLMRDQPLSLLDIAQMDLSQHHFAFLSACETAVGDFRTPDEVIHLAAGLQFAGVRSVVGTLWKVNDDTVQRLVKAFYERFCEGGTMDPKRAAWALHRAVQSLASDRDIPLSQRIAFVHIG